MTDYKIKIEADLDTSKAKAELDKFAKQEKKVKINIDDSDINSVNKKLDGMKNKNLNVKANVDGNKNIDELSTSFNNATKSASGFSNTVKGFAKFGAYLNVFQMVEQMARNATETIKEIDDAIVDLQMATGDGYNNIKKLVSEYNALGKSLGATTTEMTSGADLWLRSGRSMTETTQLLKDSTVLSKVAKMSAEDSSKVLTATLNGYQMAADQASHINDVISSIDLESAADAGGIGTALTKTASMANNAGLSLEKTAAIIATIKDVTQDADESIGNAVKSTMSRINQIKAGKFIDEETGEALNDTEKVLNKLGISMRDTNGQFKDTEIILDEVGEKWKNFDRNSQKAIATAMAGTYQYNRLLAAFDNWDKVLLLTETAQNSDGTAQQKFEESYLNSIEAKAKSLQASFEALSFNLVGRDTINGVIEATQALVEFLDKTNLAKGALAGLATGGIIKGFTALTATIAQSAIQMTKFSSALSLVKAGDLLGTDGMERLVMLTDGLSKSQLKAVISSEALSTAQRMQILQSAGMSEAQAATTLSTMGLSTAQGTATATTATFSGALKGLWATMLANPIVLVATAVTAGVAAWSAYNQSIEATIQKAKDLTITWNDSNSALNDQISKYKQLKSQLNSGTLTSDEEYTTRQQILDIQSQITAQYGDQVSGLQLVNGELDTQLAKLQQIAAVNAKSSLNEGLNEYKKVEDQMMQERDYNLGAIEIDGTEKVNSDIESIVESMENAGLSFTKMGGGGNVKTVLFKGDASQASSTINQFMNEIDELKNKYKDDDASLDIINSIMEQSSKSLNENKEVLDDYQESYNSFLEMDMYAQGFDEGSVADTYNKYKDAVDAYNEALVSGDSSQIAEARSQFNLLSDDVDTLLSKDENSKFASLFDDITDGLDKATIKTNDFEDVLNGLSNKENTFDKQSDSIKKYADGLKELDLDAQEVMDALMTDGNQVGESAISSLAKQWGLTAKSTKEEFEEFVKILINAGIVSGQVGSKADIATESYNKFSTAVSDAVTNLSNLQTILSESSSGSGISSENIDAFKNIFGDDAEEALERTANGYHINTEALAELQSQQESITKSDYIFALSDQYDRLRENMEQIAHAQVAGEDTTALEVTRQSILDQISSLEDLKTQYDSATSAYQKWIDAQNNGSERDMYENIQSGYEQIRDLIERGWGGSDEVRTYVDLLSSADLSTANVDEVIDAYNRLGNTIGDSGYSILDFFTVDEDGNSTTDGIYNFFDTVNSILGEEFAKINENGEYQFNFGGGKDKQVADALGMDEEALQSILRAASEAGFEVDLDQSVQSLEELKASAQSAMDVLNNMGDTNLSGIHLDSNSFSEITDNIEIVEDYISDLKENEDIEPEIKTEKLENAQEILEYLINAQEKLTYSDISVDIDVDELDGKIEDAKQKLDTLRSDDGIVHLDTEGADDAISNLQSLLTLKEQIDSPSIMSVDASQVDGELGDAIAKIQEYQIAVQELNVQTQLKAQGVDIDTSDAQAKVDSLAAEIQNISPDITAKLNIDTSSAESLQASVAGITPEIMVKAGIDASLVTSYNPENKNAKVKFSVDSSNVDSWKAPDKSAKLTYYITTSGLDLLPGNKERTLTYKVKTEGVGGLNGTAHANGTVKSYRFNNWNDNRSFASGDWSVKKNQTALVGELGQELVVRDGYFFTVGDNGAEFANIKAGDIIFNHKQTKNLLQNGYVTSRGTILGGGAFANGTAYSSGSGGLGRPNKTSSNSNSSSSSNTSNSKSSNKSSKSTEKAANSVSDAANKFEESFDEIEILLDRMDRSLNKLTDSIETYSYDLSKQSSMSDKAMNQIRSNIKTLQSAYNRYIKEANSDSVGLSDSWKKKVQSGSINIETITDEDLKTKIDDYQSWYEKALDVQDTIADYQSQLLDLATEKLDNIEQYFDNRTNYNDEFGYLTPITTLQQSVDKLTKELDKQVSNGVIKEFSNEWYDAQSRIAEMQDALIEATLKKYQDIIDNLDRISTTLDNSLELKEARGDKITEEDYQRPLEVANEQIDELYKKREQLLKQQGIYDVGSTKYDEYADQIADIDDEIYGLLGDIEDLKDKIWEVRWEPFFDGMEAAENLRNEMDEVRDLLDSDAFIDENGGLTAEGITNLSLISSAMNVEKQRVRDLNEAIVKLSEDLDNGNISTSEYEDQLKDFTDQIYDSAGVVEDYRNSIVDLWEEMITQENEVIQSSIDKHKELLQAKKDNDSYSRNIKDQTKEINQIQAQISALSGVREICPIYFNCWELLRALYNNITMKYGCV